MCCCGFCTFVRITRVYITFLPGLHDICRLASQPKGIEQLCQVYDIKKYTSTTATQTYPHKQAFTKRFTITQTTHRTKRPKLDIDKHKVNEYRIGIVNSEKTVNNFRFNWFIGSQCALLYLFHHRTELN